MKTGFTSITAIIDRSGSMSTIHSTTVNGLNEFIKSQKQEPGTAEFSLVRFDDKYEFLYTKPLNEVSVIQYSDLEPRGMTALHDAIGHTVINLGARLAAMLESERPENVIILIMTDGQENNSTDYLNKVEPLVREQREKYNWNFVFMGANQDAVLVGQSLGVTLASSITYSANTGGTSNVMSSLNNYVKSARCVGHAAFTSVDRVQALNDTIVKK